MRKLRKFFVKLVCLMLVVCLLPATLLACGGKKNDPNTLYVAVINKGYGTEWLTNLLKAYCAKHEGLKYEIKKAFVDATISNAVEAGASACNYDMIFTGQVLPCDANYLADLTEVYEYEYETGARAGQTVYDCMESNIRGSMTNRYTTASAANYKVLPWSSSCGGLIINVDAVTAKLGEGWENTYKIRTTDELITLCNALKTAGLAPFIICGDGTNTHGGLAKAWFAQYNVVDVDKDGVDGITNYFNGIYYSTTEEDDDGNPLKKKGIEVTRNQGTLEAVKTMSDIFSGGKYCHPDSLRKDWRESQKFFMDGQAGLRSSGDWFMTEMGNGKYANVNLTFNKTPVISALGTKLGITEDELIALIDYVDAVTAGETPAKPSVASATTYTVDQLIESVSKARSIMTSSADFFTAGAVSYSKKLDKVIDFFKFMASDEGQAIYTASTKGLSMCYGYNLERDYAEYESLPDFAKSRWNALNGARFYFEADLTTKYGSQGFKPFAINNTEPMEALLFKAKADGGKNYTEIYNFDYTNAQSYWSTYKH